ncbi:anthocyanin 5-aromatic acyltransferase-like protein [Trifolium pratense]|uniref:Anthocyanin 5-aromatic acyltransferase-like protein n=1 Tax=Trifolium pratense TaxID=57577 RepID=A0A2K3PB27_TRIPR|nr:anthocyanin 5-aromatic acyltransferase-like protein [Trifolium pratense]
MKVIEQSQVAPPPSSLPSPTTLPLTVFDNTWFYCRYPAKRIFFYHFPHPTHHFLQTSLPILKHSLSLTLQHFFPFSSNLIIPSDCQTEPYIRYLDTDSLCFTVAESSADFNLLISDSQDAKIWHSLVPNLPPPSTEQNNTQVIPIMAIQITIMPNSGLSICLAFKHVAADGKSLHHFMKFWASVSKNRANNKNNSSLEHSLPLDLPSHERHTILNAPKDPKIIYLQETQDYVLEKVEFADLIPDVYPKNVRTCLVLSHEQVQKLKKWIVDKCIETTHYMSTFVVTCSLIWCCMVKSEQSDQGDVVDDLCNFLFFADCRGRPEFSLSKTYFGNCLASYIVVVKRDELVGNNGIVVAANGINRKIRDFKSDAALGSETLMLDYRELFIPGKSILVVAGSPKHAVYETDFGWGKPKKSDKVHHVSCTISLSDCRDGGSGIEIGLALERDLTKPGTSLVVVAGSPKFAVYETDFGWGKPKKSDTVHLDSSGSISLSDCRDGGNGIEIGLALERTTLEPNGGGLQYYYRRNCGSMTTHNLKGQQERGRNGSKVHQATMGEERSLKLR